MAVLKKAGTYLRGSRNTGSLYQTADVLSFKGHAVCALFHCRIGFVSANCDGIKRAVVFCFFMMPALIYSTSDSLIVLVHDLISSL
mgnify:CR=1 FL=1